VLELSQSNVSRHLNYLKQAGLVTDRRDGYRVFYRLADLDDTFRAFLQRAFGRHEVFKTDRRSLKDAIQDGVCTRSERRPASAGRSATAS
jgi:DNA-binding transcriptional ArsR family regulator